MIIKSYQTKIPDSVLNDLHVRLKHARWPDVNENPGWSYGTDLLYIKELVDYWLNGFDWRKTENEINNFPNFIAEIDGYKIHFLHIKGKGKKSIPLILTHGWPDSFMGMMKLIPLLTGDFELSFDLVIPSLLGYGFSQKEVTPKPGIQLMGELWGKLMKELDYEKFGAHGGDFGSGVSTSLALQYPYNVIGLHLNNIEGYYRPYISREVELSVEEIRFEKESEAWYDSEGAYSHQQRAKPITLAYGLNDSPVGLCAWIIEKFFAWSDCKGDIENIFTKDELLSNVTLYWVTETIQSSIQLYGESRKTPLHFTKDEFVKVPVGISRFPFDDPFPPKKYIERGYNIHHWTEMPVGGHFAAMEQPNLLAQDIKKFFSSIV